MKGKETLKVVFTFERFTHKNTHLQDAKAM